MFKKKKKEQEPVVEQEVIKEVHSPKEEKIAKKITNRANPSSFFNFSKKDQEVPEQEDLETTMNLETDEEVISVIVGEEPWQWANNEEHELKKEKETKKKKKRRKDKTQIEENIEEPKDPESKKDLSVFFEEGKDKTQKLKRKDKKALKKERKSKDKPHHKNKKEQLLEDVKNQTVFKYNGKKYTKVEEFITYLNEHYLDIETISEEVLADENFFGWVNKNSGIFATSLKEYKEILKKIENKS